MSECIDPRGAGSRAGRPECYRCLKPQAACVCALVAPVANRTGLLILQHPRERFHAVGTVRLLRLSLARIRVEACTPWADASALGGSLPPRTAVLYPAPAARALDTLPAVERPRHLVVLDGTWFHTRKMYAAQRWLGELPHVCVRPPEPSRYRIRPEPRAEYVSTVEAVVCALRILEPETAGLDALLRSFDAMVDRQAAYTPVTARPSGSA